MRLKTNLIISALFLALLGFVYVYEIRGGEERRETAQRARQLADFGDHEVRRLTIDHGDTVLVLEKEGDSWRLTAPVATGVDAAAVERYLRALRESEIEGEPVQDSAAVANAPQRLADYGLDTPRLRVVLEKTDGTRLDTLRFGDDTPTDRFTYVQRSGVNPEVVRVRAWRYDNVDKGLHDLRDRRLLAFDTEAVRRLRLRRGGEADVELARVGDGWQLEAPLQRQADDAAVRRILSGLQNARTDTVVAERPDAAALDSLGLADGAAGLEITLWLGEDLAEKRLRLGSLREAGRALGRDSSRPQVFTVDSTIVNRARTPLAQLRAKRLVPLEADSIVAVEVREGGQLLFAAERDSAQAWTLTTHVDRRPKTWRLNSLLADLVALEARTFVLDAPSLQQLTLPPYGLDAPTAELTLRLADGEARRLLIGRRDGTEAFVMNADVASIAAVDDDDVESLVPSLDDVATEPVSEPAAEAEDGGDISDSGE